MTLGQYHVPSHPPPLRCALLWMLGEYGQKIPESPYLIEPMIDGFAEEQSQATSCTRTLTPTLRPTSTLTLVLTLILAKPLALALAP